MRSAMGSPVESPKRRDEADMGSGGLQVLVHIECGEIAAIPGSAKQRREVALGALQRIEDGGELFREGQETAGGRRLLIAQSVDEATGGEASAGDAGGEPRAIHFCEEAGDLVPTGALAGLAGSTYQHDEEVKPVAGGVDQAMGSATDEVAKGGQQLEENGGRVGFGVRSDGIDHRSGKTVERRSGKPRVTGTPGLGRGRRSRMRLLEGRRGLLLCLVERLTAQQFPRSIVGECVGDLALIEP
jgi:hypothetical protein